MISTCSSTLDFFIFSCSCSLAPRLDLPCICQFCLICARAGARSSSNLTIASSKIYTSCSTQLIHFSSILVIRFRAGLASPHSLHSSNIHSAIALDYLPFSNLGFSSLEFARRPCSSSSISFSSVFVDATYILVLDFALVAFILFVRASISHLIRISLADFVSLVHSTPSYFTSTTPLSYVLA
jgi:hypothetical protein